MGKRNTHYLGYLGGILTHKVTTSINPRQLLVAVVVVNPLEFLEGLLGGDGLCHLQHVESHGFGEGSTLSDRHQVTEVDVTETRRHVSGEGLVSFLVSLVLLDEVEVIPEK